jgi:hypothetical protein
VSYDIWLEIDAGNGNKTEVWGDNYTSNVSPMWRKALAGTAFEFLGAMDGHLASDCAPALRQAAKAMLDDPAPYEAMNPANKWGNATGAREFLESLATACELYPAARMLISR